MVIQNGMLKGATMHVDSVNEVYGQKGFWSSVQEEKKQAGGSIYGGNLNHVTDSLAQKKEQARAQAMKIVSDAWAGEQKLDADLESRRVRVRELQSEIGACNKEIRWFEEEAMRLQEVYGVADDSKEQQDLELLTKEVDAGTSGKNISLTKEERELIAEIKAEGLTEYQSRVLELKELAKDYEEQKRKLSEEIEVENAIISATKRERLKSNPMGDAKAQADALMEAAGEEIMSMALEAGMNHVNEKLEEQVEEAKERAEEEKAKEEQLENIREYKEESRATVEQSKEKQEKISEEIIETSAALTDVENTQEQVQKELKEVMGKMKLLAEDIKGAKVDEKI